MADVRMMMVVVVGYRSGVRKWGMGFGMGMGFGGRERDGGK